MYLLVASLDTLAAKQTGAFSQEAIDQIERAKLHGEHASGLVARAVKPMQVAIASNEVAKAAAGGAKVAANAALQAKLVAEEAFSSFTLVPLPSLNVATKNRFDILSNLDE